MSEPKRLHLGRRRRAPREAVVDRPVLGLPGPGRHVVVTRADRSPAQLPTFSRVCKGSRSRAVTVKYACARARCRKSQRSSGAMSLLCCEKAEISEWRWRRLLDGGRFTTESLGRQSLAGRIGRATSPPPQLGHTLWSLCSTQSAYSGPKPAIRAERALLGADVLAWMPVATPRRRLHSLGAVPTPWSTPS